MATRGQMRTWLRRRLQEVSAAQWTDSVLNDYINEGLRELADAIKEVSPEFIVYTDKHDIVADERLYPYPDSMDTLLEVWYRTSASADATRLEYRRRKSQDDLDSSGSEVSYSIEGRYIRMSPKPPAAITDGLEVKYVPILSLADDTEVPKVPANLHKAAVLSAQIFALGDTAETTDKSQVREELDRMLIRAKSVYDPNRDADEYLTPDPDLWHDIE